jgi:23S rRNA (cytidine2498-2'-O)-methyltransferase
MRKASGRIVNLEERVIVTAQAEFARAAVAELRQFDEHIRLREELSPGILLCQTSHTARLMQQAASELPVFIRHLAPVQTIVALEQTEQDIGQLATAIVALPTFQLLEKGRYFSVQSRLIQTARSAHERPYSSGKLNQVLAKAFAEETGALESIKKPQIVVSILCTSNHGYVGISPVEENLSSWPGGARHFAQTEEQISRAELKLLEALEVFGLTLPEKGRALDLGAAPGGWTRLLLDAGLSVIAVDPARLDERVTRRPHLEHYRGYADDYLEEAKRKAYRFDLIVNDMRMDAREAARTLSRAVPCLRKDGFIISVLKLPHTAQGINPLTTLKEALHILKKSYNVVQTRQLFHNRQEVTVVAAYPVSSNRSDKRKKDAANSSINEGSTNTRSAKVK